MSLPKPAVLIHSELRSSERPPSPAGDRLGRLLESARAVMRKDKGLSGELDRIPVLTWLMFLKFLDDMETSGEYEASLRGTAYRSACESPYRWRDWAVEGTGLTGDDLIAFVNQEEARRPDGETGPGLFAYLRTLRGTEDDHRPDVIAAVFRGITNRMINGYLLRDVIEKVNQIEFSSSESVTTLGHLYESLLREMRDAAGDSGEFYTPRPLVRFMVSVIDPQLGETVLDPAAGTGGFLVEAFNHLHRQARSVEDYEQLQRRSVFGGEAKPLPYLLCQMNLLLHGCESPAIDPLNSLRFPLREIGDRDRVDVILTNPPFGGEEERGILGNFPADLRTSETAVLFLQLIMRRLRRRPTSGRAAVVMPNTTLFFPGVAAKVRRQLLTDFAVEAVVRLPKGVFEPYTDIETNIVFFRVGGPTERVLFYRLEPPDGRKQYTKTQPLHAEDLAECAELIATGSAESPNAWYADADSILNDPSASLDLHNPKTVRGHLDRPAVVFEKLSNALRESSARLAESRELVIRLDRLLGDRTNWTRVPLRRVLRRRRDAVAIEDDAVYKRLRIQVKGRGVLLRDETNGARIGTKRQFRVEAGQFLLSKIDARNGAFGIVPEEADGAVITGNFWTYEVDDGVLRPRLLHLLTRSDAFLEFCLRASPGATNRRYLQEEKFLDQEAYVPASLSLQDELVTLLEAVAGSSRFGEKTLPEISRQFPALLQSSLHAVFANSAEVTPLEPGSSDRGG